MLPLIEKSRQAEYGGRGVGTSADPYTTVQYDTMCDNGQWNGGYVEELGYVNGGNGVYIYGNSDYPGHTSQDYYTFPDYISSLSSTTWDWLLDQVAEGIPVIGQAVSYAQQEVTNTTIDIQRELLEKGYNASSSFNVVRTDLNNGTQISVYDANTGQLITSRIIGK